MEETGKLYPAIKELFMSMSKYDMNYLYFGDFSPELTNSILSFAESSMDTMGESTKIRKKVYFIMVESLQNITRHQASNEGDSLQEGYFIIQGINNGYFITSCNTIENGFVRSLQSKLDMVNSLDQENLKQYSSEILQAGEISKKGGAGLGLIEMARKSGNKLEYFFEPKDNENSYFYFQIKVTHPGSELPVDCSDNFAVARSLQKLMLSQELNIVFQGGFSQENVKGILAMIEGSFAEKSSEFLKRKTFNIIMELLQNIYKHGDTVKEDEDGSRPGIFLIGAAPGGHFLAAGNLIANNRIPVVKKRIDEVNAMGEVEMEKVYAKTLLADDIPGAKGAGLGFLDIRMKSQDLINYNFETLNNEFSLLTLAIRVSDKS
jgi:hypothetical protein